MADLQQASSQMADARKLTDTYFLGLDLSTQQLKGIVVNDKLKNVAQVVVNFDSDLPRYKTCKGVYSNEAQHEVHAPVEMWLEALDLVMDRLKETMGDDMCLIQAVSGACQQHATVYWRKTGEDKLKELSGSTASLPIPDTARTLKDYLADSFSWTMSPNWQDASTARECRLFEEAVGGREALAQLTGSRAHRRFSGPQILKVKDKLPQVYRDTYRVMLASNMLASVIAGKFVGFDCSDVCGMNLWDIERQLWDERLLKLFGSDTQDIVSKLGPVHLSNAPVGTVAKYFEQKYGLSSTCQVYSFTGDNPGTILALPLRTNDVVVSLGTSTTALVVTEKYTTSGEYHMFQHPVEKGRYMGMLCYCNGALAREKVRDALTESATLPGTWQLFDSVLDKHSPPRSPPFHIGFYFPLSEIVPECDPTVKRYEWNADTAQVKECTWSKEEDVARIVESQALSIRQRMARLLTTESKCPARVFFVGGASQNLHICRVMANVLGAENGSYCLKVANACATGAANRAAFGSNVHWSEYITQHWDSTQGETEVAMTCKYPPEIVDAFIECEKKL